MKHVSGKKQIVINNTRYGVSWKYEPHPHNEYKIYTIRPIYCPFIQCDKIPAQVLERDMPHAQHKCIVSVNWAYKVSKNQILCNHCDQHDRCNRKQCARQILMTVIYHISNSYNVLALKKQWKTLIADLNIHRLFCDINTPHAYCPGWCERDGMWCRKYSGWCDEQYPYTIDAPDDVDMTNANKYMQLCSNTSDRAIAIIEKCMPIMHNVALNDLLQNTHPDVGDILARHFEHYMAFAGTVYFDKLISHKHVYELSTLYAYGTIRATKRALHDELLACL